MARPGDVLENPVTGERLVFRRTSAETNGEALEYELTFRPAGFLAQDHLHPRQSERHEVVEGRVGIALAGADMILGPGESVDVPPATPHRLFPVDEGEVRAVFELRPALDTEGFLETMFALARDGKLNADGTPGLLQLAAVVREFPHVGHATKPPLAVQRLLFGALAPIARVRGYRGRYG